MSSTRIPYRNKGGSTALALLFAAFLLGVGQDRPASSPMPEPARTTDSRLRSDPTSPQKGSLNRLVTKIVLDNIPHNYTDDDRWGGKAQRFNGVRLRREGWRLETKRDWVDVNHGVWQKTSARLVDPEHQFAVSLDSVRPLTDSDVAFDLTFSTPLALEGRQSHWVNGVQLYSLSIDAEAKVRLSVSCSVRMKIELRELTPVLVLDPSVTAAELHVDSFAVKRVSKLGGEFAQQVTQFVNAQLSEQVASQNRQLVEKINRQLKKHADAFRIPLASLKLH